MNRLSVVFLWIAALLAGCTTPDGLGTSKDTPPGEPQATGTFLPTDTSFLTTATTVSTPTATVPIPTSTSTQTPNPETLSTQLAPGFPPQPEGIPFPAFNWPEGAWPAGVNRAGIDQAVETAFASGGERRVRAVVIVYGGQLIYERYSPNPEDGSEVLMPGYSIAKSITSALAGILVRDGNLSVDEPAAVREWSGAGDARSAISVDDLLRMTSGLEWEQGSLADLADQGRMIASGDAAAYAAGKALVSEPGKEFLYSSGNTMILSRIITNEVGTGQAFRRFLRSELLDKIGIEDISLDFDPAGTWIGAHGVRATARDFARFGLLYLRDGVWDGERLLPEGWVDYSRTPTLANPEYGASWWLDLGRPGVFYAIGVSGQVIGVDPEHDLMFVTLATDSNASLPVGEAILEAWEGIEK